MKYEIQIDESQVDEISTPREGPLTDKASNGPVIFQIFMFNA